MKRSILFILLFIMSVFCTSACAENTEKPNNSIVVYFSATGNTEGIANKIQNVVNGDIYEIIPSVPYTSADLEYTGDCRANREQNDDNARPEIAPTSINIEKYNTIFVGYPIWWGTLPKIMYTFFESYDLSGKTIIPFCTSGSSGIKQSENEIKALEPNALVLPGRRLNNATESELEKWIDGLDIPIPEATFPSEINIDNDTVKLNNAPNDSTLILVFYKENTLVKVILKSAADFVGEKISDYDVDADLLKVFLWDMNTIKPLSEPQQKEIGDKMNNINNIYIHANDSTFTVNLTDNSSAKALVELLKKGDITVDMHDYASFEKVGPLGTSLPRNDESITTQAGDLILYQGNNIVIYYDTNTWSFTSLGKIENATKASLLNVLGNGNVTVRFSLNK